ncbi:MAG: tRNA pseudouridine(38-40) synthase TruA [Asgard group archaeon]|nr:tRNA pseudouridine(38-40) synthase TruA [Asgard group archaeon]
MSQRYAIKIAYLGQKYQGFQRQKKPIKTIEDAFIEVLKELNIITEIKAARYSAAGRTDKGVNAICQVLSFDSLKEDIYLEEINQNLPRDIYAWAISKVHNSFSARRDATRRTYRYYHSYSNENIEVMKKGIKKLLGTHDFVKLCKKPDILPDGYQKSTLLTLDEATVNLLEEKNILEFEFSSKSFLWNQVRKMVSLILKTGRGEFGIEMIDEVFNPKSKLPKGGIKPVPPEGLVLYDVIYPDIIFKPLKKKAIIEQRLKEKLHSYNSLISVLNIFKDNIL